jgi:nucleoside-diphosphate-sugar epimerase
VRTALVIGGRGQCGTAITRRLVAGGWSVTATTSGTPPDPAGTPGVSWVALQRNDAGSLEAAVPGEVDLVVDVMALEPRHAEQLCALGDRVGAAIVLSTLSVYSDLEGRSLETANDDASFPAWPVPLSESWPTLPPGEGSYSERKAAIEQIIADRSPFPSTVLRPGAIHGENGHHLREWWLIKRVVDHRRRVVLPYDGESIFQPTATVNLAELVALAAERPGKRVLNCADLDPPSVAGISAIVDELMGFSTERVLVSGPPPAPGVGHHPWATPRPVVADMSRARDELGYREAASYADALAATLAWALRACADRDWTEVFPVMASYDDPPFDYEAEDAFLAARSGT